MRSRPLARGARLHRAHGRRLLARIAHSLTRSANPNSSRVSRANGWTSTTLTGSHSKGGGLLRNPIFRGDHTWNKSKGKKRPGTGRSTQKVRPASEHVVHHDESLRIVSDDLWARVAKRLEAARHSVSVKGGKPARYLLSGLLECSSCSASYIMRNERNYVCGSHTNGRDSLCSQRRPINRAKTEERLLAGIRAKLAAPALIKHMTRAVQARLREQERPDCGGLKRELAEVERELQNVVTAIGKLGGSAALLSRVRELEAGQAALESEISTAAKTPSIAPNVERIIRRRSPSWTKSRAISSATRRPRRRRGPLFEDCCEGTCP